MTDLSVNAARLLGRLRELGQIGRDGDGRLIRLAGSDADKAGRDAFVTWLREVGLEVAS
jgi:N-carbamoyl-L-amino-acid hydrolase